LWKRWEGELNAATSYDYTYYYVVLPANHWETGIEVLSELVLRPNLSEEKVKKEIPIVLEEIARSENNPHEVFSERFMEKLYSRAPYKFPILGYKETVSKFSAQTVQEFYESLYKPDRITVSIGGNVNADDVLKKCKELFGWVRGESETKELKDEGLEGTGGTFEMEHPTVAVPYVLLGWKLPATSREDVTYELLETLLSLGRSSLLYRKLNEREIVYSSFSNYQNLLLGSNFTVGAVTDRVEETVKEIREIVKNIESVPVKEFLTAKKKAYRSEVFSLEDVTYETESIGFALGIVEDISYHTEFLNDLKSTTYEDFLRSLQPFKQEPLIGILKPTKG